MRPINNKSSPAVPKLRFPEFVKEGEWVEKELRELGDLINGLTYSPKDVRDKGLLVLRSSNIKNGLIDFDDCVFVRLDIKGANLSEPDDILVCVRNGSKRLLGKNALIPKEIPLAAHGAFMTVFRAKYPEFVFQLFQSDAYNKQVKADLGATINSINGKNFLKYEFLVPKNPKEQQKIADCLSSLDALIATQTQKLQALQQHKKGLMQNLFPAEGKTTPKLRFPEFVGCETWAVKSLKDISETTSGGTPLKHKREYYDAGAVPWLTSGEVAQGLIYQSKNTITELGLKESSAKIFPKNTILIAMYGATAGKVGLLKFKSSTNQAICGILPNNKLVSDFLYQYLVTKTEIIAELGGGGAQPNISQAIIKKLKVPCPEKQEQQKIADCLSSLDALITTQTQKLQALQQHKKGLMQGLFPIQLS